jgi:hypothetical protein
LIAKRAALAAGLMMAASVASAQGDADVRGHIGVESWVTRAPAGTHQHEGGALGAIEIKSALTPRVDLMFAAEGKKGLHASAEDAADLRELLIVARLGDATLSAGIGRVFWGVAESRHLVNVINQPDYRFASDGLTALGQPMVSAATTWRDVRWQAFLLPCYRPQALPRSDDTWVDMRCDRIDTALRTEWSGGPADIGLAYFNGHARNPIIAGGSEQYPVLRRWSLDAQLTLGSFLWKVEALREASALRRRQAHVAGVEYTFAQLASTVDLAVLYENLRESDCPPLTCANVIGLRVGANDSAGSQLLLTRSTAVGTHATSYLLRGERRLSHHVSVRVEAHKSANDRQLRAALRYGF